MAHEIREAAAGGTFGMTEIGSAVAEFRARLGEPRVVVMSTTNGQLIGPALAAAKLSVGLLEVPGFPEAGFGVCNDGSGIWFMPEVAEGGADVGAIVAKRVAEEKTKLEESLARHAEQLDKDFDERVATEISKRVAALPSPTREMPMAEEGKPVLVPGDDDTLKGAAS